jgi:hypothetical protein
MGQIILDTIRFLIDLLFSSKYKLKVMIKDI